MLRKPVSYNEEREDETNPLYVTSDINSPVEPRNANQRLRTWQMIVYGAPNFAGAAMWIPVGIHINKFYADVVLVPVNLIALAVAISRSFDAITYPVLGYLSDRLRSRWGRRRPFIAVGAPLCALSYYLLFSPPAWLSPQAGAVWFCATFFCYFLFLTMCWIPHYALGAEMSSYEDRTKLFGWGEGFTIFGTIIASVAPGLWHFVDNGDARHTFKDMAFSYAVLLCLLYMSMVYLIKEKGSAQSRQPFIPGMIRALRNRPFVTILATYCAGSITSAIPGTMLPFFVTYVVQPKDHEMWLTFYLAVYYGTGLVFLPAWIWLARRVGKKPAWLACFLLSMVGRSSMFLVGQGQHILLIYLIGLSGIGHAAWAVLATSIQADVIDYDEFHTGERREGQYTTFWSILPSFLSIPGAAIPIAILGALGYVPNQEQPPAVILAIRIIFSLTPAVFSLIAFLVAYNYPITEAMYRGIQAGIQQHKQGHPAIDPLTSRTVDAPAPQGNSAREDLLDCFTKRELEAVVQHGPRHLLYRVMGSVIASIVGVALSLVVIAAHLTHSDEVPCPVAVCCVVTAGLCFALTVFNILRISPSRTFQKLSDAKEEVVRHLAKYHH